MLNANAITDGCAPLLLTNDAARVLGLSPQTVRVLERNGQLRALRTVNGVRLFDRRDVENLARARDERRAASAKTKLADEALHTHEADLGQLASAAHDYAPGEYQTSARHAGGSR
jgi:DNA-binding transcriptional MerR regulator